LSEMANIVQIAEVMGDAQSKLANRSPQLAYRFSSNSASRKLRRSSRKIHWWILPAGSVEQHGPHLPTGTDILPRRDREGVAERMDGLVLPGGPLG